MIMLIGTENDPHILRVQQEINLLGVEALIINPEQLGKSIGIEIQQSNSLKPSTQIIGKDWEISSADIGALWLRRVHLPSVVEAISDPDDRHFAQNEWNVAINTLSSCLPPTRVLNLPMYERAATKTRQLQIAAKLGFRIPDTLITSLPGNVNAFVQKHHGKVIHKALTAPSHAFIETRRWSHEDSAMLELLPLTPIMLQEEITGIADLRISIVGENVYAAIIPCEIDDRIDSRLYMNRNYQVWNIDLNLQVRLKNLLRMLGLSIGMVDMKLQESGECVFFEVNPQGQFLYIEIMTGQAIAQGFAVTLTDIAHMKDSS